MKLFNLLFGVLLFFSHSLLFSTTINGRFTVINITSSELSVLLQINTDTGADDLGGATIAFSFDTTAVAIGDNPVNNVDYFFHNFYNGNYSPATITKPIRNQIWVNIDLPFTNNNNGTIVTASPGWTDVVTIHFDIVDPNGAAHLTWQTASPFWGIYDANNSTLWQTGEFTDLFGPLPVELVSFTASVDHNNVILKWKTATETNNSGFEILRANVYPKSWSSIPSGEIRNLQFEMIGFVQGQGTSTEENSYSFTDKDLEPGSYSYKLVQLDFDGTKTESEILNLEVSLLPEAYTLSQNYPNPFNPSTKIKFTIPSVGAQYIVPVQLKVFDILGNEVATLVDEEKEPGIYEVEFRSEHLSSGIYIYKVESNAFVAVKKMVLLR
ncbi:MAG: T9SS type A sorting domain-containing protein [Ignavibacteriaceae bacterium]|nr:T9SS type A sorting domain-containing protein [Ignavibacteriaceae bacterium]